MNYDEYFRNFEEYLNLSYSEDNAYSYKKIIEIIKDIRSNKGRVFIAGMGGSAGNAQHMANDLRKMCYVEAYSVSDNIAELTARINDDGWDNVYVDILKASQFSKSDGLFVLSVSGGSVEKSASIPLVNAMRYAVEQNGAVMGIVGNPDSFAAKNFEFTTIVTPAFKKYHTQFAEAMQGVFWHGLVSDPSLMLRSAKW